MIAEIFFIETLKYRHNIFMRSLWTYVMFKMSTFSVDAG